MNDQERSSIFHENVNKADCSVIAIQAVTGWTYPEAEALALRHGYGGGAESGKGMWRGQIEIALGEAGYKMRGVPVEYGMETVATFAMDHPNGIYLLYTHGHVGVMVDGDVFNEFGAAINSLLEQATEIIG